MGYYYNSQCTDQTCSQNCCNYYGSCPDSLSSSYYMNQCWYNYNYQSGRSCTSNTQTATCCYSSSAGYYQCQSSLVGLQGAALIGPIAGGVVGSIIFIIVVVCIVKKCRAKQGDQVGNAGLDQSGRNTVQGNGQGAQILKAKQPQVYQQPQQQFWGPADQYAIQQQQQMQFQQQQATQFYQDPSMYQPQNYQYQQPPAYFNQPYPQQQQIYNNQNMIVY